MNESKTVLVTGATGMVGRVLCQQLESSGHCVRTVSRTKGTYRWDVGRGVMDAEAVDGVDCIVHLAGEPISQRWTAAAKARVRESRIQSTRLLVNQLIETKQAPDFICASGVNYYGTHAGAGIDEASPRGAGFLASVCHEWEAELKPLEELGARVVQMRIGVVLSANGGALKKMLPPFRLGLGGRVGSGRQLMSWIALSDLVRALCYAVEHSSLSGPVNAVAPTPVSNAEFTAALGHSLRRPTVFPLPVPLLKVVFGEMAEETLLSNIGAHPTALQAAGFEWKCPTIQQALEEILNQ